MTLAEFKSYVDEHSDLFTGTNRETEESLAAAEEKLGFALPETMKWLLKDCGYSGPCGIESLEAAIETTIQFRVNLGLPPQFLILNDWGEVGVVYMDSESGIIYWGDEADATELVDSNEPLEAADQFQDYPAWVADRLQFEIEQNE